MFHMTHIGEIRTRLIEIIRQSDAVKVVGRAEIVDHGARSRVEEDRHRQCIGEGYPDGGRGLARRVLFVDLLDWNQEVLAIILNLGRRAVREPDDMAGNAVARHLACVKDIVEHDEPSLVRLTRLGLEAEIGA